MPNSDAITVPADGLAQSGGRTYRKISKIRRTKYQTQMFLVSSCSWLCPIQWSQVLSREWRCSWSSADRRCSNYIWVIDNCIAYQGASYIRDLMVCRESDDKVCSRFKNETSTWEVKCSACRHWVIPSFCDKDGKNWTSHSLSEKNICQHIIPLGLNKIVNILQTIYQNAF